MNRRFCILLVIASSFVFSYACARPAANNATAVNNATANAPATPAQPAPTPAKNFTSTDIAKLKWLEGTWRGMDGDKPFYERYRVEESAMIVETLKEDGSVEGEPDRFELKNGEFGRGEGDKRSVATEITADHVQFVPAVAGKGNNFRFVKTAEGWDAILEWSASGDKPAGKKVYKMETWKPKR